MSDSETDGSDAPLARLPRWQALTVLVGFPLAYWINGLTPWSYGLFVERDHRFFLPFGVSICLLHWASLALTLWFVRRSGATPREIGLHLRAKGLFAFAAVVAVVGGALIALRTAFPIHEAPPGDWRVSYPFTLDERIFFVFLALSAGFCEEVVYRGFAITALRQRGWRTWQAVALATLSFVMIHGVAAIFLFPFLIAAGLIYGGIFLWRKSLTPLIYLHALFDVTAVLAV